LGSQAVSIAVTISSFIESDIESYKALNSVDDYDTDPYDETYYLEMNELFAQIKAGTKATYVYTMKKVNDDEYVYMLDAEVPGSDFFSPIGSNCVIYDELQQAFDENIDTYSDVEYDEDFDLYLVSANSPINDPDTGVVIGVVGVDYSYEIVKPLIDQTVSLILTGYGLIVLVISLIVFNILISRYHAIGIDYLTGLFSKRYFDSHLRYNITDAKIRKQSLSLMMIDVDDFKLINDDFGHLRGDKVLKVVAENLRKSIRRMDTCARYGGDEFSIILPDAHIEEAVTVAQKIINTMNQLVVVDADNKAIPISVSIGISEWNETMTPEKLVNNADQAMYTIKKSGMTKIAIFKENKVEQIKRK
jgi:diguanylate cyclase (GGDEF)-like protein